MVLCPHSECKNYLLSTLLLQQTPFLQKERSKKLWVCEEVDCGLSCLGTNGKHVYRGTRPCPDSGVGTKKKVVFSLLPSDYRIRAPSGSAPIFSLVILVFIDLRLQILVTTTSMCI